MWDIGEYPGVSNPFRQMHLSKIIEMIIHRTGTALFPCMNPWKNFNRELEQTGEDAPYGVWTIMIMYYIALNRNNVNYKFRLKYCAAKKVKWRDTLSQQLEACELITSVVFFF